MNSNPWAGLAKPSSSHSISAKRVDPEASWSFFWTRDDKNRVGLLLQLESVPDLGKLPVLTGLTVELDTPSGGSAAHALRVTLSSGEDRDLFAVLCDDILKAARASASESEAVTIMTKRLWRWHFLLRQGHAGLLTPEEQKGLLGELQILGKVLIPEVGARLAVEGWVGPLGEAKDFLLPALAIEAKAVRGSDRPFVRISSEDQLESLPAGRLFLWVSTVERCSRDDPAGTTLNDFVEGLKERLLAEAPETLGRLDEKLHAAGYRGDDDYSEYSWITVEDRTYEVVSGFPRITASGLPHGVAGVRYQIMISALGAYQTTPEKIIECAVGGPNV